MDRENIYQEKELLLRIAAGDEQAFSVFFHQYRKKILYVSKLYLKTEALAEEAMQDVFMKV